MLPNTNGEEQIKLKRDLFKAISPLLITAMLAPDMGTLISHGATYYQEHHSRYVNFMRPDALTLAELDLATTSNVIVARNQEAEDTTTATTSNAALRQPEKFYAWSRMSRTVSWLTLRIPTGPTRSGTESIPRSLAAIRVTIRTATVMSGR